MSDGVPSYRHPWDTELRSRFPDWLTDNAKRRWPAVKVTLRIGQTVSGEIVARAPFGVWLDIQTSFPALLLVPNMKGANERRIEFDHYPAIGTIVTGRINALGDEGEIVITQHDPDKMVEREIPE